MRTLNDGKPWRLAGRARLRIAVALGVLSLGAPVAAASDAPGERRFGDWTLRCEEATCWIYDSAPRERSAHLPYGLTIGIRAERDAYRVLVHTLKAPRLMRSNGIEFYVDGLKAGTLSFARCGSSDCIFLADYTRAEIEGIAAARSLVLLTPDAQTIEGVASPVSTIGLEEAFSIFRAGVSPGLAPR